jgi:CDP-diacylglycerol---serine O-phosphatidyltransferase
VFVLVVLFFALLIAYPWPVLTIGVVAYLASLPFGALAYRKYERQAAEAKTDAPATAAVTAMSSEPAAPPTVPSAEPSDRPSRLN